MTTTDREAAETIASAAIEIVQDCRKALGLQTGESLTDAVIALHSRLEIAERERDEWTIRRRGADRLAGEVAKLIHRGVLDMRSPAADALLDYDEKMFVTPRTSHPTPESKP